MVEKWSGLQLQPYLLNQCFLMIAHLQRQVILAAALYTVLMMHLYMHTRQVKKVKLSNSNTLNIKGWYVQLWPKSGFDPCVSWPPTAAELWRGFVSPDAFSIKPECKHKLMVCGGHTVGRRIQLTDNHPTQPSCLLYNIPEIPPNICFNISLKHSTPHKPIWFVKLWFCYTQYALRGWGCKR